MKQDPSRGGGSTLSPAYSAALQQLVDKRTAKKPSTWDNVLGGLKGAAGLTISPFATAADIVAKPFELIPGVPDVNPESVGSVNLFVQGGKSLQHVYGDAKELGRSIITGKDTLSQSPSARAYQAAGGGLTGTLAAAGPYLDVASVVAPAAMGAARGAGVVAPKAVPYKPLTNADIPATPYRATRNALAEDMAQAQLMTPDELGQLARTINADAQITGGQNRGLSYFWGGEPMINDRLRGDYLGDAFDAEIAEAQAFFQRVPPLQQPVKVFRGIMVEEPEAGTNAYSDFVRTWKPGDVIEEPGFMSTTIDRKIAEGYSNAGRILEIEVPKGTRVATPEMFGDAYKSIEQELTLPPNTKLQITSVSNDVIKARVVPSDTPTTNRQAVRDALLRYTPEVTTPQTGRTMNPVEELASAKARAETAPSQPKQFSIVDDRTRQVFPSMTEGSFRFNIEGSQAKPQVTYSVAGTGNDAIIHLDAESLAFFGKPSDDAIDTIVEHLNAKYPNLRIATTNPELQQALNARQTKPVLRSPSEPIRNALTFKPVQPDANETADAFSRRLAQGDQTFDRVTFTEPYEPRGTSVFVHRTLPDQAERLLVQGMEPEPRSWLGNMGGRTAGEGVFPEGTLFASQMGSPTDELFAQAMNDQFGDIRGGVPLQVTLPQNARVLEIDFDLPDISPQDFTEAGLSAKEYYDFLDILESLGGNRKNETAVKGALAQLAQREAFDAVVLGEELMVIPRPRNPELMQALKRFVEWEEDDL
jgi:hypothetical protein